MGERGEGGGTKKLKLKGSETKISLNSRIWRKCPFTGKEAKKGGKQRV